MLPSRGSSEGKMPIYRCFWSSPTLQTLPAVGKSSLNKLIFEKGGNGEYGAQFSLNIA
jgi:hypothetical protein